VGTALSLLALARELPAQIATLPLSTQVMGGLAAFLSMALIGRRWAWRATLRTYRRRWFKLFPAAAISAEASVPAIVAEHIPPTLVMVRDTPAALSALELAYAYIQELQEADRPDLENQQTRKEQLNTLALAARQLDVAEKSDPDAILEGEDKDGLYRFSIGELKGMALLLEGLTHQAYDLKRAIPALTKSTEFNPNNPAAFYALGLTHAVNLNKAEAVAAFERAVALDPKNLQYRKELDRAQNVTGLEIAGYKVTRAGERVYDAGIKTATAGIFVYNIGVYAWNTFAVIWNIVTFPIRIIFKIFGLFERVIGAR